jgi:hypothetical protein
MKPFVFVIMPFSKKFDDVYELGIKQACEGADAECQRVDKQIFVRNMLEQIYKEIERAQILVAEVSERNPNVFYEVGYAHGTGKHVIFVTTNAKDIPFDLRHYPHVIYENISKLKEELERKLRHLLEHPAELGDSMRPRGHGSSKAQMGQQIEDYLEARGLTRISFEGIRKHINPAYTDDLLGELIDRSPYVYRRTLVKDRPAIALLWSSTWNYTHPADYAGLVWIRIEADEEQRHLRHDYIVRWGPWEYSGTLDFNNRDVVTLMHTKQKDDEPHKLHFAISQPCRVNFGRGIAPPGAVDINKGWKKKD